MSDEEKKRIVSQPPPPTDEVDGEWGADEDDKTLVREAPEGVTKSQPAPPAAVVAGTAVAPISVPSKAAEASTPPEMKAAAPVTSAEHAAEQSEEEEDEESSDAEDEPTEEHDEEEDEHGAHVAPAPRAAGDWIPEWAPFAVLALLVSVSILVGLGLVGGSSAAAEEEPTAEPAAAVKAPVAKPSKHP